jgi:hypothetical protein
MTVMLMHCIIIQMEQLEIVPQRPAQAENTLDFIWSFLRFGKKKGRRNKY